MQNKYFRTPQSKDKVKVQEVKQPVLKKDNNKIVKFFTSIYRFFVPKDFYGEYLKGVSKGEKIKEEKKKAKVQQSEPKK